MWDAWAAYDEGATGYFVDANAPDGDKETAISFAAYEVLRSRYALAGGGNESLDEFESVMTRLCLDPLDPDRSDPTTAAGFGTMIAEEILTATENDGSRERDAYISPDYVPVNDPMIVSQPGTELADPNRWQPLLLDEAITQNGIPLASGLQTFVGAHWGFVTPFALAPSNDGLPLDPGPPPWFGTEAYAAGVVEVIELGGRLTADGSSIIDISPASLGNNRLGTNDGSGYVQNPATGEAYAENRVDEADFGRVIAEFWADGPSSETPPGHWNTMANQVSDDLETYQVGGVGPEIDRLEWDVKLYFALNAANHDAAIAAWGTKAHYDYIRPISMIRYMGDLGQSSDPALASYHPDGLPLVPGLIELGGSAFAAVSSDTIAVRFWMDDGYIEVANWAPYQAPTFVTPSFAGYVSGHSAFSRASAEVLTAMTGSEFFPGGLAEWVVEPGDLEFDTGPSETVTLQWATYYDAADQAGRSRLYGGIHVTADDVSGRELGAAVGISAWEKATAYFGG